MKGQIQIGETIAVLLIFMVLVGLGFAFYAKVNRARFAEEMREREQKIAIQKAQTITHLPELVCSSENVISDNCVDLYKVNAAMGDDGVFGGNKAYYRRIFGNSVVKVRQITPVESEMTVFSNPIGSNVESFIFPVIIHDPILNLNNFGLIQIEVYPS